MQKYFYKAKGQNGETITGQIESANEASAAKILMAKKMIPIEIKTVENLEASLERLPFLSFLDRVSKKKKAVAVRQLATLINSGLPITQSLESMTKESSNKKLTEVFSDVLHEVEGGSSLANAFSKHSEVFSNLDTSLITAGEKSGTLDKVLNRMATQLEKDAQLLSKVRNAMIYPAFILVAVIAVIALMLMYVVPKLVDLYKDFQGELPAATKFMIAASNFLLGYWWLFIILIVSSVIGFKSFINVKSGRRFWDYFKIKVPGFKILVNKVYLARFTRTLGTLIGSGVPVLDALKITSDAVGNIIFKEEIIAIAEKVQGGDSLSVPISNSYLFPDIAGQMIKVGEQTGEIDSMLDNLANYYEEEVDNTIKGLSTLIEPVIIVFMGVVVAGILISIMAPIYNISQMLFRR